MNQAAHVMKEAASRLRELSRENAALRKEASQVTKLERASAAVQILVDRGRITRPEEVLGKLAELTAMSDEDLAVITKAAQMDSPTLDPVRAADATEVEGRPDAESRFIEAIFR